MNIYGHERTEINILTDIQESYFNFIYISCLLVIFIL